MAFYEKEDVVVPRVDEYAVYKNVDGDIVVSQSADGECLFVSIPKTNVAAIANRMLKLAKESSAGGLSCAPREVSLAPQEMGRAFPRKGPASK